MYSFVGFRVAQSYSDGHVLKPRIVGASNMIPTFFIFIGTALGSRRTKQMVMDEPILDVKADEVKHFFLQLLFESHHNARAPVLSFTSHIRPLQRDLIFVD